MTRWNPRIAWCCTTFSLIAAVICAISGTWVSGEFHHGVSYGLFSVSIFTIVVNTSVENWASNYRRITWTIVKFIGAACNYRQMEDSDQGGYIQCQNDNGNAGPWNLSTVLVSIENYTYNDQMYDAKDWNSRLATSMSVTTQYFPTPTTITTYPSNTWNGMTANSFIATPTATPRVISSNVTIPPLNFYPAFIFYIIGIAPCGLLFFLLFKQWFARSHRHNPSFFFAVLTFISFTALLIAAVIVTARTNAVLSALRSPPASTYVTASTGAQFFGLTWAATGATLIATLLLLHEWNIERFTPLGQKLDPRYRPKGVWWFHKKPKLPPQYVDTELPPYEEAVDLVEPACGRRD